MDEIISTLNSGKTCLKDCVSRHKLFQNDLQVFESDQQNLSEQLTAGKEKSEELHLQLDSQQADLSLKKTTIDDQIKNIEELKDHLQDLKSQLVVFIKKEIISLNNKINQFGEENTVTFKSLSTEKNHLAHYHLAIEANIREFQLKVANLESELKTTNGNFSSITSDIVCSKETYELKLEEFQTALEVMKSENDNLSSQIKDFVETETALKETMKIIEAEKENMSENLLCEIKKVEDLQINIKELKANLSTRESEICDRDKSICNLKTEVQDLRRTYEAKSSGMDEIISTLNSEKTCLKDCVSRHKLFQNDLQVFESDQQNLSEQLTAGKEKSEELHLQLDSQQADLSLKKTTIDDQIKNIEELKLKLEEFQTALEVMKSENDNLSSQIKDFVETETALKETMKIIEAEKENMSENLLCEIKKVEDLQINIKELKANLSTRESEICDRDKSICNLKTEVQDLRRTYELKLHNLKSSLKFCKSENDNLSSQISCSTPEAKQISDFNTSSESMPSPLSNRKFITTKDIMDSLKRWPEVIAEEWLVAHYKDDMQMWYSMITKDVFFLNVHTKQRLSIDEHPELLKRVQDDKLHLLFLTCSDEVEKETMVLYHRFYL